jgi:hypothetical membrane protein
VSRRRRPRGRADGGERATAATATRVAAAAGAVVALSGVAAAATLADAFSPLAGDLSDLGVAAPAVAAAFDGGLVAGGVLAAPLARSLWRRAEGAAARIAAAAYGLAAVSMAGVGAFPAGTAPHVPAAVGVYLGATVALGADGLARRGSRTGRAALALAAGHVACWAAWLAVGPPGLAVPETAGALALAAWVLVVGPLPAAPAVTAAVRARP